MTFEECELLYLEVVDKAEKISSRQRIENPEIRKIIDIVETF